MAYIEINNLHYEYENGYKALNGLSLKIEKGDIFGFLGPNGAGKTTTFKLLLGLIEPDKGNAFIDGKQIRLKQRELYKFIGYMSEVPNSYDEFTVEKFLHFIGMCHSMNDKDIKERCDYLFSALELNDKRDQLIGNLSTGQKQKTYIIRALLHDPDVLILDEPASGLDPNSRKNLMSLLIEEKKRGKTIIISSHILPELADLCTSIAIIYEGRLIEKGYVSELIAKYQNPVSTYKIYVLEKMDIAMKLLQSYDGDELQGGFRKLSENTLIIDFKGDDHKIANILEMFIKIGVRITRFEKIEKDIETIYGEIINE